MIGAALVNALWQGAFVVTIAAAITALLPGRAAATRYAVWFCASLALAVVPFATLWQPAVAIGALPAPVAHTMAITSRATHQAADASGWVLAGLWIAGAAFCLLRLVVSFVRITNVVRTATPAPGLGPDVLLSETLDIPIAVGLRRPVVVLPAFVPSAFGGPDVESVLRHERAHIARMDVAGNLVQRLIEAVFFFNPWVYVVGRQLLKEREAACDDRAVAGGADPNGYASILARLAQTRQSSRIPLLTPSALGPQNILVGRIARLLDGKEAQLKVNYYAVGASVVSFAVLAFALLVPNVRVAAASNSSLPANCYHGVTVKDAAPPNIPKAEYKSGVTSNALVTVDAEGKPVSAKTVTSSGSDAIDHATIDAAMHSTYSPEVSNCKAKTSQYLFHVETGPQP